mgnify:CR=1 FL=1
MAQNTPAPAAGQKPKKVKKSATSGMSRALVRRETTSAYLFLLPSLIFFVTFVVVPMFICVYYSFTDYGLGGVKGFAGLLRGQMQHAGFQFIQQEPRLPFRQQDAEKGSRQINDITFIIFRAAAFGVMDLKGL